MSGACAQRILFDSRSLTYKSPFGCLREDERCHVAIDVPQSCPVLAVRLVLTRDDGFSLTLPLTPADGGGEGYRRYTATFALYEAGLYFYAFRFEKSDSSFTLYRLGDGDTNMEEGELWQLTCLPKDYHPPHRFAGQVMYQIFPDRFAKSGVCNLTDKLTPYRLHADPREIPERGPDKEGYWNRDFYGGNLRGITERLPYFEGLGVGILYLNPIFYAASNHRYDTADYKRLDPMLGSEEDFVTLCREAKARGIAIILDGVFSHVGEDSRYFDRYGHFGHGALSDPASPYRDWFTFRRYPDEYECWWEVKSLPCVKELSPSFLDLIIRDEDSVVAHWMRLGASGFRLDVADELPDAFIALLRARVKELDPEALVLGEVWEDASNKISYGTRRRYFSGGELDGVMNYPFREAILDLVSHRITGDTFLSRVLTLYENYPREALLCSMSFLGTHDTPRVLTELKTRCGEEALAAMKAAVALQFFLPGIPSIYYGDELGMEGGEDPENRRFLYEGEAAGELLPHYRAFGALRQRHKALREGDLTLSFADGTLTVTRACEGDTVTLRLHGTEITLSPDIKTT